MAWGDPWAWRVAEPGGGAGARPDHREALARRKRALEAEIAALAGQVFRLEGDDELWKILDEDCFEWSDQ